MRAQPASPRLGATAWRRIGRRWLALLVAILAVATALHHLAPMPEHGGMAMHHGDDHAAPAMVLCLGVVGGGFLLAYVGGVVAVRRAPRRRPRRSRRIIAAPAIGVGRARCRDGPPLFLRHSVLRT